MKQSKTSYAAGGIALLLLMAGTFFFLLKDCDFAALLQVIKHANPLFILGGLLCVFLFIACEGLNIFLLMRSMGQKIGILNSIQFAFVGFYFSAITPSASGGQPMQVYFMQREKYPVSLSTLCFLMIGAVYQIVMLCFGGGMFLLQFPFLRENIQGIHFLLFYGMGVNLLLISLIFLTIFFPGMIRRVSGALIRLLAKCKLLKRPENALQAVEQFIAEYRQGAQHIRKNPKVLAKVFLVTAVQLLAFYSVPFFVYCATRQQGHGYLEIVATECILMISVSSLPLPGAVGASEASFLKIFSVFFGENVVAAMLLSRGISFYSYLLISGVVTMVCYVRVSRKKRREASFPGQVALYVEK